jgi:hypothetical protein
MPSVLVLLKSNYRGGHRKFFEGPLIAYPLTLFLKSLNANTLIFKIFQPANRLSANILEVR